MVFSSFVFLYGFLPLVLLLYFIVGKEWKNTVLLLFSLLFYAWGEPAGVFILLVNVAAGWIGGRWIERAGRTSIGKLLLLGSVAFQVLFLVYYKYLGFAIETIQSVTSLSLSYSPPSLPIGISFFTFHVISYLVDVYRREAPALSSYSTLLLYIALFPQLVAGPIIRYADIQSQLKERNITADGFSQGIVRFVTGLGKKVIVANSLAEIAPLLLDSPIEQLTVAGAWLGIFAFALQIYFDFSGYSDMAIGLGKMFGFTFKENFDYPYVSTGVAEFWRRWNMSVGRFFRDYVYIPMGGNRKRAMFNMFIVWFLTGLWHGASWNFVVWGLYFGLMITLEKSFLQKLLSILPTFVSRMYFAVAVLIGWVFFYFESLGHGTKYLRAMFGLAPIPAADAAFFILLQNHIVLLTLAAIAATPIPIRLHRLLEERLQPRLARSFYNEIALPVGSLAMLVVSALLLVGKTYSPFFYFRF
ncbi:MBOAT family protein [Paenibacillus sp. H1-7]|uniref:MBOAT family O-acyltransferase n=1 Tax=Paenibacillus sp. H1-7 TaxID=2282849 RepID=UPI001EF94D1A|nr:MBOAT family O-acyltransferase [Paenibacillus sp. H1-7]ULL16467.1 MBOAT family protein [Paenibacillus sp. H1-7]